jgi:cell division protein FtsI/penicillin-binding protein 2
VNVTRRELLALAASPVLGQSGKVHELGALFGSAQGSAIALDSRTGEWLAAHRMEAAHQLAAPPGSVIKPLVLQALIEAGKLRAGEALPCSGHLRIGGASFACVHPKLQVPLTASTALAYSCNQFIAKMAARFAPGELADALSRYGLSASQSTGAIGIPLQALGQRHVTATVAQMATAYQRLTHRLSVPANAAILQGMEEAVVYGTAQHAAVPQIQVAGKTGTASGSYAWFAGFAPSQNPRVVVAVLARGHAGGADAAPIASRIFAAYFAGKL